MTEAVTPLPDAIISVGMANYLITRVDADDTTIDPEELFEAIRAEVEADTRQPVQVEEVTISEDEVRATVTPL